MASEAATRTDAQTGMALDWWQAGIVGGVVGGVVFGVMMTMEMRMVMEMAIPGMYGLSPGLELGWVIHLFHSAVFGVVFAAAVRYAGGTDRLDSNLTVAVAGLAYGLIVWVLAASILMPAWVNVTMGMGAPVPDFVMASAMGHAVYGVLLGIVYAVLAS